MTHLHRYHDLPRSSVETLNSILDFFSAQQRKDFIDSIKEDLPVCSSREWRDFLSHCTSTQCDYYLQKISRDSCLDLYDKNGLFAMLISLSEKFSLKKFERILTYIHQHFPEIVPSDLELDTLRFTGGRGSDKIERIRLILKTIEPDLTRLNLSIEESAILELDVFQDKFHPLIRSVITTTPQTSSEFITSFILKSPEEQLIDDLANLSPYWLAILNIYIDTLNWHPSFTVQKTQNCWRTYLNTVKPSLLADATQPRPNHVFFLKTLSALALSAALLGVGLLIVYSTLPTALGATLMLSGAVLGFFAYKARNAPEVTTFQNRLGF